MDDWILTSQDVWHYDTDAVQVEDYDEYGALPVHEMYVYSLPPSPPPSSPASTRSRKKNVMKRDINMLACDSDVERECCPSQASVKDNPVVCDVQESATARDDAMSDVQTSTCRKRERCATFTVVDYEAEIRNKERSRRQKLHGEQLQCSMCHTTETCQWRSGPNGPRSKEQRKCQEYAIESIRSQYMAAGATVNNTLQ